MTTRTDLARLTDALQDRMVLSATVAREHEDPGQGGAWKRRLSAALSGVRSDIQTRAPADLEHFDRATEKVMSALEPFGRVFPHEGWAAFATADGLEYAEGLSFHPREVVRWRQGPYISPLIRSVKSTHPVVLALLDRWHARIYRFQDGGLSEPRELQAEPELADASDVGVAKRASGTSGVRGMTGADYAQRSQMEEAKRFRGQVVHAVKEEAGDGGAVVVGGTREAIVAARKELEDHWRGQVVEVPELSFDLGRDAILDHVREAATRMTEKRQLTLVERSADPRQGSRGWNETYRALAAGAVDTLLVARELVEDDSDDAERLVRLALAQGADVEEVGGALGERLMNEAGGAAARLRFVPASLQA